MNARALCLIGSCLTIVLAASCSPAPEWGGAGAACEGEMDCGSAFDCVDGVCVADGEQPADAGADAVGDDGGADGEDADGLPDGGSDAGACGGACADPTPVCDSATGTCVACLVTEDCESGACNPADNSCVECVESADCDAGVCDTDSNTCVACLADADCSDAGASACDTATNTCVGCSESAQCGHVAGATICDVGAGCVECLDVDETTRAACGGNSCDPATGACTETPVASLTTCDFCMADSECPADYRCVPMEFQGTARNNGVGGYCLRTLASGACVKPYQVGINRESINGVAAEVYCGIAESQTTCEAVRDLVEDKPCVTADDCGAADIADGRCESIVGNLTCTYGCEIDAECPTIRPCGPTTNYCGGT